MIGKIFAVHAAQDKKYLSLWPMLKRQLKNKVIYSIALLLASIFPATSQSLVDTTSSTIIIEISDTVNTINDSLFITKTDTLGFLQDSLSGIPVNFS